MISTRTKNRWDYYNVIDGAKILGREEGKELGEALGEARGFHKKAVQIAIKLKNKGVRIEEIREITELSISEIQNL